jgi:hypothetical protein
MVVDVDRHGETIRGRGAIEISGIVHAETSDYEEEIPDAARTECDGRRVTDLEILVPVDHFWGEDVEWCDDCWSKPPTRQNL